MAPSSSKEENRRRLLLALADSVNLKTGKRVPLNSSQLQKRGRIKGRQTTLNLLQQFDKSGLVDTSFLEWRKNRHTRYYALNDNGERMLKAFPVLDQARSQRSGTADIGALDFALDQFRQAMMRGKSPALNYEWALIMTSDSQGRLSWRVRPRDLSQKRKKAVDSHMPSEGRKNKFHRASSMETLEDRLRREMHLPRKKSAGPKA